MPTKGAEMMVRLWRSHGWTDDKIWLHRKFTSRYFGGRSDPCRWCGMPGEPLLYLVPGRTPDGKMNWICQRCAVDRYGHEIDEEMSEFSPIAPPADSR